MSLAVASIKASDRHRARRGWSIALPHIVNLVARLGDILTVVIVGILVYGARVGQFSPDAEASVFIALAALLTANIFSFLKLYDRLGLGSISYQLPRLLGAWSATLAAALVTSFMLGITTELSRLWILTWFVLGLSLFTLSRIGLKAWVKTIQRSGELTRNVLVIGDGASLAHGRDHQLRQPGTTTRVIGRIDVGQMIDVADPTRLSDAGRRNLLQLLTLQRIDHVCLILDDRQTSVLASLLRILRHFPLEVGLIPSLPTTAVPILGVQQIEGLPSLLLLRQPIEDSHLIVKAALDRTAAALMLLFLAPVMLLLALGVKLSSPGPVLFRQKRLGFNQQPLDVFKFRSMYVNECDQPVSDEVVQATRGDPRVTPLGRILRRTSLDELPQLINVLQGEMSLVGPRPHAIAHDRYYAELIDDYLGRHRVKPGITGWAQVNGFRGETRTIDEMRQRIEYDLQYIDNWSLFFDLRIIFRTLFVVFTHDKAY